MSDEKKIAVNNPPVEMVSLKVRQAIIASATVSELMNIKGSRWAAEFIGDILADMSGKSLKRIMDTMRRSTSKPVKKIGIANIIIEHWVNRISGAMAAAKARTAHMKADNGEK